MIVSRSLKRMHTCLQLVIHWFIWFGHDHWKCKMASADAGASHASTASKREKKAKNLQLSFSTGSGLNSRHRGGRGSFCKEYGGKSPWKNKEQGAKTPKASHPFSKSQNIKRRGRTPSDSKQLKTPKRTNETRETWTHERDWTESEPNRGLSFFLLPAILSRILVQWLFIYFLFRTIGFWTNATLPLCAFSLVFFFAWRDFW